MKGNEALAALWAALDEGYQPPPPNSINVHDYMDKTGLSMTGAKERLGSMVRAGKLEVGKFNVNGKLAKYYWLPKGKNK